MKTKSILLFLIIFSYFSCSKDNDNIISGPTQETQGSVFVTIKDPAGIPVAGAQITLGNLSGTTDETGTYFFTRAMLTGDDYLTVAKAGYFKGSRRFFTKGSPTQFLQVTLLPHKEIASYRSSHGASLYIDAKSRLIFPNNAVALQDGSPFNGDVHVMAYLIYGDDPKLSDKMPGALVGKDESGSTVALGSFGMIAVELQADNGEILQIAEGKTVEIEMAIADNQLSHAPSTIPLWHFDEDKGLWVEEGQAELQGNVYVGQVSHFSFWNWDVPLELVNWEASFEYSDGRPAQYIQVCLSVEDLQDQRCAFTDAKGFISGPVPADRNIILTVANDCGTVVFTDEVGPFMDDIKMETITVAATVQDYATISGTALQCDGSPVKSGFVKVHTPLNNFMFPITGTDGHFEGGYTYCVGDVATLYVYDVTNTLVSHPRAYTFERNLNIGSITACNQLDEFIRFKVTGFSQEYFYYSPELTAIGEQYIEIESLDSIGVKGRFGFVIKGLTVGQYSANGAHGNQINLQNGQIAYINSMTVNITEFGPPGEFIRGDFNGKINKGSNGAGGSGPSDFNGTFALKNE